MSVLLSMQENETPESAFHKVQDMFCDVTDDAVKESISDALDDEVGNTGGWRYAVVSHGDDPCNQRHELHGVKKLYEGLSEKGANVHIHGHDRNVSINNYLKTQYPEMTNCK